MNACYLLTLVPSTTTIGVPAIPSIALGVAPPLGGITHLGIWIAHAREYTAAGHAAAAPTTVATDGLVGSCATLLAVTPAVLVEALAATCTTPALYTTIDLDQTIQTQ